MSPTELFDKCMKGSLRHLVKGGLVYQYIRNPFFVWCEAFAPKEEKDPESAYMNMIFENGRNHETEVLEEMFPGGIDIDPTLHDKAFAQTLDGLFGGEQFIKNGILYYLPLQFVAVPDVLEKKEGSSLWGEWHYEVIEIKSSKQIREEQIMQAAYYNHLIGIIQGYTPATFTMIGGQKEKQKINYSDYENKVKETIREMKEIFKGRKPPIERIGWPWQEYSLKQLKERKAISLIPSLPSTHKEILLQNGVSTLEDFFSLNILGVEIPFDTMEKYRRFAKAFLQGKHSFLDKPFLPEGKIEIFMDFEGVEQMRINGKKISGDYLIGVVVRENGQEIYTSFLADSLEKEHDMLLDFLKFLQDKNEFVIYHFGSYEKSHLASLLNKYGIDESFAQKILHSMVDIFQLAKKSVIFPTHSYSLKEIAKYLGFQWTGVADAKDSIVLYLDFIENNNKESLEKIIQYNKDDCLALKRVKDFLVWGT